MRVVVIGAGFAGLAAADELRAWRRGGRGAGGARPRRRARVVARARRRLDRRDGRRVHPRGEHVVQETAERLGLDLLDKGMSYGRRELRGADPFEPGRRWTPRSPRSSGRSAAGEGRGLSARELIDRLEMPTAVREALAARTEVSAAGTGGHRRRARRWRWSPTSTTSPRRASPAATSGSRSSWRAGSRARCALSEPARSIAWSEDSVTVRTDAGEVEADRVRHRRAGERDR